MTFVFWAYFDASAFVWQLVFGKKVVTAFCKIFCLVEPSQTRCDVLPHASHCQNAVLFCDKFCVVVNACKQVCCTGRSTTCKPLPKQRIPPLQHAKKNFAIKIESYFVKLLLRYLIFHNVIFPHCVKFVDNGFLQT